MNTINVKLHLGGPVIDMLIPRDVTTSRLREVITEELAERNIELPDHIGLRILQKALHHEHGECSTDYVVMDGDHIGVEYIPGSYTCKGFTV